MASVGAQPSSESKEIPGVVCVGVWVCVPVVVCLCVCRGRGDRCGEMRVMKTPPAKHRVTAIDGDAW